MLIQVYHNECENGFVHVADITAPDDFSVAEAMEYAYIRTQNTDGSWSRGPDFDDGTLNLDFNSNVSVSAALPVHNGRTFGLRSTMMGDRMVIQERTYTVAAAGFEEVVD